MLTAVIGAVIAGTIGSPFSSVPLLSHGPQRAAFMSRQRASRDSSPESVPASRSAVRRSAVSRIASRPARCVSDELRIGAPHLHPDHLRAVVDEAVGQPDPPRPGPVAGGNRLRRLVQYPPQLHDTRVSDR